MELLESPRDVGNCDAVNCVSRAVLSDLSSRWAMLIVRQLRRGDKRFAELRHGIDGISEKMLAQTLRTLERNGLVRRTSYDVVPPHVSYSLTPLGHECAAHVSELLQWFETRAREFTLARRASA